LESYGFDLGEDLLARACALLQTNGVKVSGDSIVDATLIAAPHSNKYEEKIRDSDLHKDKKGNQCHFGTKVHVLAEHKTGLIHSVRVTEVNVHHSHEVPNLLHDNKTHFYGDIACWGKAQWEYLKELAPNAKGFTSKRSYRKA